MIPTELQKAFKETHYIVLHNPPFTLRVGELCPELDALLQAHEQDCAAFITAWNPNCEALDAAENETRQQQLISELKFRDLKFIEGTGKHPSNGWPSENSVLILGLQLQDARQVSRKFGQLAFVWQPIFSPAQLEQ